MKKNLIIVEGLEDQKFIQAVLTKEQMESFVVKKVTKRGGKNEFSLVAIKTLFNEVINEDLNKDAPDNILLICDADFKESQESLSGVIKTQDFLKKLIGQIEGDELFKKHYKKTRFSFFIIPNNKDDGNLDSLFLQGASEKIAKKTKCVDSYLKCLEAGQPTINKKDKLYSQLLISAIGHKQNLKNLGDVANEKSDYWNLSHKSLDPLKKFLKKFKD